MAAILAELCQTLIEMTYGELCAQIFSTLAEYGRLTLKNLCLHTKLPLRPLKHGLIILLEQHMIKRFAEDEDEPAFYSVEWMTAYNIVRQDSINSVVRDRYGETAARIILNVGRTGQARLGDIEQLYHRIKAQKPGESIDDHGQRVPEPEKTNGHVNSNGHDEPQAVDQFEFHSTVRTLLLAGFLSKVTPRSYIPYADYQEELQELVISEKFPDRKINGSRKKREFIHEVQEMKRRWREEDEYSDAQDLKSRGNHFPSNKRPRLNGNSANGHRDEDGHDTGLRLSPDLVIRVDYPRCIAAMRTRRLQQLADRYLGPVTAEVYGTLLKILEDKSRAFDQHQDVPNEDVDADDYAERRPLPLVNIKEIVFALDDNLDLASAIKGPWSGSNLAEIYQDSNGFKTEDTGDDDSRLGDIDDDDVGNNAPSHGNGVPAYARLTRKIPLVEAHLKVLEEHSKPFCRRAKTNGGENEWQVNIPAIVKDLITSELDEMILSNYGRKPLRLVRMIREKGKLDEKQIGAFGMLLVKDVAELLCPLKRDGILESQELPKDNSRQPSRSFYFWYIDDSRVLNNLLQKTYKTMARHLQRMAAEKKNFRSIIEKTQRFDIKGREQQKLNTAEKEALRHWRDTEEKLIAQVSRLDELVALLRDYSGTDTSLRG